ncbi:MAG: ATP-dependent DNA helicase RecG [Nitrospirae bacterium]|nr:ATP-dependent DNA helicase RecG [Nitrospirota bacterium]
MVKDLSELNVQYIKGVGPQRAKLLNRLGTKTVHDLLYYLPYRYEDRRNIKPIRDITVGFLSSGIQTVSGRVIRADIKRISGRLEILELTVSDGSGFIVGKWFNQRFLKKKFTLGIDVVLSGTVKYPYRGRCFEMENPEYELIGDDTDALIHTGRLVPVYSVTEGVSSRQLRSIIYNVLKSHLNDIQDPIPQEILKRNKLIGLKSAIMGCHFPEDELDVSLLNQWQSEPQKRLIFDELFMLQSGLAILRRGRLHGKGIAFDSKGTLMERLRQTLPFRLTEEQGKALGEILNDMKSPYQMNRLLQGDVGCGKTIVAVMAMLFAVEAGYQAGIMAPTEILAEQHYINIHGMLESLGLRVCLVTSSVKKKPLDDIAKGRVNIVIGTHALIEETLRFERLGLIVIDEQHRFGVRQRAGLRRKSQEAPDVLVMTATPIPRTLAMTLYGDLDYSRIDDLPPGRKPVVTRLVMSGDKKQVYEEILKEVRQAGQVYVVYPVIEESEKTALKSAIIGQETLKKIFPSLRVSLIHGKMKPFERESIMTEFKKGKIDILVSTTVIEVGVDVPNASLMVVVHSERFGLSQLHQLRGRVGRGGKQSRCLLLAYGDLSEVARRRLDAMVKTTDGFRIAEEDLEIRGPGELFGTKQSGIPDLRIASLLRDASLLEIARKEAFAIIEEEPLLQSHLLLKSGLKRFWEGRIELFKTA